MSPTELIAAAALVAVVLAASAAGLLAHLAWLLVRRPGELLELVAMFARVVMG